MNIYRLTRPENKPAEWDNYVALVVIAENEEKARNTLPDKWFDPNDIDKHSAWIRPEEVVVEFIGTTDMEAGILLSSFRAG